MFHRRINPVMLAALGMLSLAAPTQPSPPNDLWPVRRLIDLRPGCHVLNLESALDPRWDELVGWLAKCPPLTGIETFWVCDGLRWSLLVTGVDSNSKPLPSGEVYDPEVTEMRALHESRQQPIRPDYAALKRTLKRGKISMPTGSMGTETDRPQSSIDYSISFAAPAIASIQAADRAMQRVSATARASAASFDRYIFRGQQRANRKRRAARKRRRGWA